MMEATVDTAITRDPALAWGPVLMRFGRYAMTLTMPVTAFVFLLTGPHEDWYYAGAFWLVLPLHRVLDWYAKPARSQPVKGEPNWLYNGLLYLLFAFQIANILLLCRMFSLTSWFSFDGLMAYMIVGTSGGFSAIVVAHELMHRPQGHMQFMARLLMGSVLYDHFCTEHIRGHHVKVGTYEDPATARYDETFLQFFRRTVPAQFRSAWRIEIKRLQLESTPAWHPAMLKNRVLQGVIAQVLYLATATYLGGYSVLIMLLANAFWAVRLLESVNYFEHWGLVRKGRKVRARDSWDTESSFTLYGLVGLTRHADHHAYASRPYHQLRHFQESPKFPGGYITMVTMLQTNNKKFMRIAKAELERCKLGPFAEDDERPAEQSAA